MRNLFIHRKDLRIVDNTALNNAAQNSKQLYSYFIFDPNLIQKNPNSHAKQFLHKSLDELSESYINNGLILNISCNLNLTYMEQLESIIREVQPTKLYMNADYTPYGLSKQEQIESLLKKYKIDFVLSHDLLLNSPGVVLKDDGSPYTVFTPYFNKAKEREIKKPREDIGFNKVEFLRDGENHCSNWMDILEENYIENKNIAVKGGRSEALHLLSKLENFDDYNENRNYLDERNEGSKLSAHNKFGTISIREFYYKLKSLNNDNGNALIRQLYWRDFYYQIGYFFPYVYKEAFQKKYKDIPWVENSTFIEAWKNGKTGFPIVDAGMRQLNETGYMHNRARMVVASFLTKDLHIDWSEGERYFAEKLTDYDKAVNNGSWQWAASTGCDAQPYFRIFNPWLQQKKFDPEAVYIKKWIPELRDLQNNEIHNLFKQKKDLINNSLFTSYNDMGINQYPLPLVDHKEASNYAKEMFKS